MHTLSKTKVRLLAVAAAVLAIGLALGAAKQADAATPPTSMTAHTYITNRPDSGDSGTWAYDRFTRQLSVAYDQVQSQCGVLPNFDASKDACYDASIDDSGHFTAIQGMVYPNAAFTGKISHPVSGNMNGLGDYLMYAPATDTLISSVLTYENDDFVTPNDTPGHYTTGSWPLQALSDPSSGVIALQNDWTWTYTDNCQSWTDAYSNNSGDGKNDGNIDGNTCVLGQSATGPIKNVNSSKCLDVSGGKYTGGLLQQWTCGAIAEGAAGGNQNFKLVTFSNDTSALEAVQLLAPKNSAPWFVTSSAKGAQLTLKPYYTSGADVAKSGNFYKFTKTGLVMDVSGLSKSNGAVVHGWTLTGATNQQWSLP